MTACRIRTTSSSSPFCSSSRWSKRATLIPRHLDWQSLERLDGEPLDAHYRHILVELGKKPGMLGTIFRKAQNRVQDPAKLKRLISDLIGRETWPRWAWM